MTKSLTCHSTKSPNFNSTMSKFVMIVNSAVKKVTTYHLAQTLKTKEKAYSEERPLRSKSKRSRRGLMAEA